MINILAKYAKLVTFSDMHGFSHRNKKEFILNYRLLFFDSSSKDTLISILFEFGNNLFCATTSTQTISGWIHKSASIFANNEIYNDIKTRIIDLFFLSLFVLMQNIYVSALL